MSRPDYRERGDSAHLCYRAFSVIDRGDSAHLFYRAFSVINKGEAIICFMVHSRKDRVGAVGWARKSRAMIGSLMIPFNTCLLLDFPCCTVPQDRLPDGAWGAREREIEIEKE